MSSTSNVLYVDTPLVLFRGKMWNVMMSCAYLQDEGKMWRMDDNVDAETHHMSIFDKYMPATPEYAEAIDDYLHENETNIEPDLTSFYKLNETFHVRGWKPRTTTKGNRRTTVKMIDGVELDGFPGGRHQDVLILTVGSSAYSTRRVKFVPAFAWNNEVNSVQVRSRRPSAGA
jgi:hypothetical protein